MDISKLLVDKSIEAFIMGLEIYNKPTIRYRVEGFSFFICNAWELMLKAHIINLYGEKVIYYKDSETRTITLELCVKKLFTDKQGALRKNMNLTFKIDMLDNDNIDILKLKVEYILTLNNEALDISESFIKKILSKFYPIFSKLILNFYNSIGLNNVQLPEF